MSVFSKIKDAIFGRKAAAQQSAQQSARPAATAAPGSTAAPPPPGAAAPRPGPASAQPARPVDVEAILEGMAAKSGRQLNWRTSIVDLMKLLGMESSLAERKELAQELGYTGALDGSADMNLWLHKRVMQELAAHGGKVPSSLLH